MEPQFQTSFIPKKPLDSGGGIRMVDATEPIGILPIVAWVLVIVAIVLSGGLFAYQRVLKGQISTAENNIIAAKEAFQPDTINQLVNVSNQIAFTQMLLSSHILVNKIFDELQSLTVKKIYFVDFSYSNNSGTPTILMDGESQSYNALAEQYDIFNQSGQIQNPIFSNFDVANDGNIAFKFTADVNPSLISYQQSIQPTAGQ